MDEYTSWAMDGTEVQRRTEDGTERAELVGFAPDALIVRDAENGCVAWPHDHGSPVVLL